MSTYSRVKRNTWNDARFRQLSTSGKLLWLRLLTAPEQRCFAGLFQGWHDGLRQSTGLSSEEYEIAWSEISSLMALKRDDSTGLIFLINALKHEAPSNPNQLKAWLKDLEELPECELKNEAFQALNERLERFAKRLAKPFPERLPKPKAKTKTKTNDQAIKPSADVRAVWDHFVRESERAGCDRAWRLTPKLRGKIETRLKAHSVEQLKTAITNRCRSRWVLEKFEAGDTGIFSIVKLMHSEDKIEHWLGRDWERQPTRMNSGRIAQQGGASADDIEAIRAAYAQKAAG